MCYCNVHTSIVDTYIVLNQILRQSRNVLTSRSLYILSSAKSEAGALRPLRESCWERPLHLQYGRREALPAAMVRMLHLLGRRIKLRKLFPVRAQMSQRARAHPAFKVDQ